MLQGPNNSNQELGRQHTQHGTTQHRNQSQDSPSCILPAGPSNANTADFFKLLCNEVASRTSRWELVAINLDIDVAEIEQISSRKNKVKDCFMEVFKIWRDKMRHPFNWNTMVDVLDRVEEHFLAKTLREKYLTVNH